MSSPLRTESRLGGSLVGLCAVALLALGCSDDFIEAQNSDPILLSMRWPDQRAQVLSP